MDQPIVKTTSLYFSYISRKQINDGNSSRSSPLILKLGDMLKTSRLIDVEKTAIDGVFLNITATNRPVGSQAILCGSPPITRLPFCVALKSAIGNDCFGAAATV